MHCHKFSSILVLAVATVVGLTNYANGDDAAGLRAGAAAADVTPQHWPIPMVGSFSRREATHAWDPLNARALVLDNGATRIGLVIIDSCYCPRSLLDDAKQRASKLTGISTDHLLMAATHTHTAPPSRNSISADADKQYVEHLTRGIVSALSQATANLAPAEIGWGAVDVPEEVFNRRWYMKPGGIEPNPFGETTDVVRMNPPRGRGLLDRPAGPVDPQVCFLSVRTPEGRPISLLANYSLHYVGGIPGGGVSADYFGEFARQMERRFFPEGRVDTAPPFVAMLSNGTSGDVNNINFTSPRPASKPFVRIREVAGLVADRVEGALKKVEHHRQIPLAMAQSELTLKLRRPTPERVQQAKEFLAAEDESNLPRRAKAYARWTMELNEHPGTEDIILQAVRIGDVGIATSPCETFTETGLYLKAESPLKPTFTIELANGHYGYLPTPRQHRLGGYETWLGTNRLELEASDKIEAELLKLLRQVAE
ncbi:MAG: neutral/alkaline non-lysosomal ceramidase N-terminal domain-containing protein [Pirellulaceae bacterium]